ncbi:DUF4350 domain-containing protein [Hymenobacter cheonanensis]|uniref:DUF4350 domain-containing protein n=1 Tax=Hymenobacter sp. CA2-7 TaxID=3063993 RepID=UPI00350E9574
MTSFRLYLLGLLALFGAYVALEYYRPKPLDWRPTLSNADKIPYGTYALFDVLPQLLGTEEVTSVRLPVYNQFFDQDEPEDNRIEESDSTDVPQSAKSDSAKTSTRKQVTKYISSSSGTDADSTIESSRQDSAHLPFVSTRPINYLFINNYLKITESEAKALLVFVNKGNDIFIAATDVDNNLSRLLGMKPIELDTTLSSNVHHSDSVKIHWFEPALAQATTRLPAEVVTTRISTKIWCKAEALATDEQGRAVFMRLNFGRGHVYLCTVPLAFSNYFVLPPRQRQFALAALSYLPTGRPVWWDEYQKQGRAGEQSVLRVVFSQPSLRTAYYLLWATALLFIFVEARRRQRIIPVLNPLPNTTLLFTRTVASLYRQGRNHQRIADKKTALFLDYLRARFQEPAPDLADEAFRERLSQKSGVSRARLDELVRLINFARTAPTVTDRELLTLSRAMHDFKREAS